MAFYWNNLYDHRKKGLYKVIVNELREDELEKFGFGYIKKTIQKHL